MSEIEKEAEDIKQWIFGEVLGRGLERDEGELLIDMMCTIRTRIVDALKQAENRNPEGYVLLSVADFNEYQRMKAKEAGA